MLLFLLQLSINPLVIADALCYLFFLDAASHTKPPTNATINTTIIIGSSTSLTMLKMAIVLDA